MQLTKIVSLSLFPITTLCASEFTFSPEPQLQKVVISETVRIIADSQLHELYGAPTYSQSAVVDNFVEVAVRPSQQRVFGDSMFSNALTSNDAAEESRLAIHLGDALDVSCTSEWTRFLNVVSRSRRVLVLAPGNHDGYYLGNLLPPLTGNTSNVRHDDYGADGWRLRCGPVSPLLDRESALAKPDLLSMYADFALPKESFEWRPCDPQSRCLTYSSGGHLRRLHARATPRQNSSTDKTSPWESFILQEIDLSLKNCRIGENACPPVRLLLLDTSQFGARPRLPSTSAGVVGSMLPDQLELAQNWSQESSESGGITLFAGHHPLSSLDPSSKRSLLKMLCMQRVPMYISAHTHTGYWKIWKCQDRSTRSIVELNIGSVLDYPVQARTLTVSVTDSTLSVTARLINVDDRSACKAHWIPTKGTGRLPSEQKLPARITTSPTNEGRSALLAALKADLMEYRSLIQEFPTTTTGTTAGDIGDDASALGLIDAAIERISSVRKPNSSDRVEPEKLLGALRRYEQTRLVEHPAELSQYKVCLAAWAAELDHKRQQRHASRQAKEHRNSNWKYQTVTMPLVP